MFFYLKHCIDGIAFQRSHMQQTPIYINNPFDMFIQVYLINPNLTDLTLGEENMKYWKVRSIIALHETSPG